VLSYQGLWQFGEALLDRSQLRYYLLYPFGRFYQSGPT